jgi:phage-related protein
VDTSKQRPNPVLRPIHWCGDTLKRLRGYPELAQDRLGHELYLVQRGEEPTDYRPMPIVGDGVREIRVHLENEYRVLYVANVLDRVVVLHAFVKKSQATPGKEIQTAKRRLAQTLREITYGTFKPPS